MEQIAVLGDVHGCINQLNKLLEQLDAQYPGIEIYSTGDLVDRGPSSKEVVQRFIDRKIIAVRGNHDEIFRTAMQDLEALDNHLYPGMGGKPTARSYGAEVRGYNFEEDAQNYSNLVPEEHKEYISSMPFYRVLSVGTKKYLLTHAGLSVSSWNGIQRVWDDCEDIETKFAKGIPMYIGDITWNHKRHGYAKIPNYTQVVGHLPVEKAEVSDDLIMIDTGCGKGGMLSAIILPDNKLIEIEPD